MLLFAATTGLNAQEQASSSAKEVKAYELDFNLGQVDRLEKIETYLEGLSNSYKQLQADFQKEKAEHLQTRIELEALKNQKAQDSKNNTEELANKVSVLEQNIGTTNVSQLQSELTQTKSDLANLSSDYNQAKALLGQIKLLIQADYAQKFNNTTGSNNQLKGIVEEINKIQLPTPQATPTPTPTATATPIASPTPSLVPQPTATPPVPSVLVKPQEDNNQNFLEKYPEQMRQEFCRKPENLQKFQKECLPYL